MYFGWVCDCIFDNPRPMTSRELSLPVIQITPKNKTIENHKVKQGVCLYRGLEGAETKNGLYFVLRPLIHCVLAWFLFEGISTRQKVIG